VIHALDGPLTEIRGLPPEEALYNGAAGHLQDVWMAVRVNLRGFLGGITLQDVFSGDFRDSLDADRPAPYALPNRPRRRDLSGPFFDP
jgi:hypothetical protein